MIESKICLSCIIEKIKNTNVSIKEYVQNQIMLIPRNLKKWSCRRRRDAVTRPPGLWVKNVTG